MKFIFKYIHSSKYLPFCILLFLASKSIRGQESDSLKQYKIAHEFLEVGEAFKNANSDSCLFYRAKAEEIFYKIGAWRDNIIALNRVANSYYDLGQISKTQIISDSALFLANSKLDPKDPALVPIYNTKLVIYRNLGLYEKSKKMGRDALSIPLKEKSSYFKSVVHEQCSKTYLLDGDYQTAKHHADLCLSLSKDTFGLKSFNNVEAYYTLALVHQRLEQYADAIENLKLAIENAQNDLDKGTVSKRYFKCKVRLSEIYCLSAEFDKADQVLEDLGANIKKMAGRNRAEFYLAKAMYIFHSGKGETSFAKKLLKASNDMYYGISISKGTDQKFLENLTLLSEIYKKENNQTESKAYLLAALDSMGVSSFLSEPDKIERKILTLEILDRLLDFSIIEEDQLNSEFYIGCIKNLVREIRHHSNTDSYKKYWAKTNLKTNEKIVKYFISIDDLESAFNFMEENKSNILINDIKENMVDGYAGVPKEVLKREFQLRTEIGLLDKFIFNLENSVIKSMEEEKDLEEFIIEREHYRVELVALKKELEAKYSSYYNIKYNDEKLLVKDIQNRLDVKTLFIEYFVGIESTFVCFISKNDIVIKEIDFSLSTQEIVLSLYNKLSEPIAVNYEAYANRLYNVLLGSDLRQRYKGIEELIIVPDDILCNLPFSSLSDENGQLLLENFSVHYQYSYKLGKLLEDKQQVRCEYDFVGYSFNSNSNAYASERSCSDQSQYNLVCSEKEVHSIISMLEGMKSKAVSEGMESFLDAGKCSKILHLATHACLDDTNPKFSRIYFNDGFLTNVDLKLKSISSDLVVLSACETGYGKIIKGEGSMSLSKGFFHAGAKSTLVSLWSVDDCSTAQIMEYFYSNLKEGHNKSNALRRAKLKFWKNANAHQKHPYFWSGFVLIGDNSALWSRGQNLILIFSSLALLIIALFFVYRKKP